MNIYLRTAILSAAVAATTLAALPAANAGDHGWRGHHGNHHRSGNDDLALAGILGLAAGALVVGLATRPEPASVNPYRHPRPQPDRNYPIVYDEEPGVVYDEEPDVIYADDYASGIEPWSRRWYGYCADRYRSFDARSGTFTGYDGQRHFCVAN